MRLQERVRNFIGHQARNVGVKAGDAAIQGAVGIPIGVATITAANEFNERRKKRKISKFRRKKASRQKRGPGGKFRIRAKESLPESGAIVSSDFSKFKRLSQTQRAEVLTRLREKRRIRKHKKISSS